jgi:NADPH:quinone reductase
MRACVCRAITQDLSGVGIAEMERPVPEPDPDEVLIRVRAASLNFPDILMCQGLYQFKPALPFVPGLDVAGEIVALGAHVSGFEVGQAVVSSGRGGGLADFVSRPADSLKPKPDTLSWTEAAAYPVAYLTAWVALVCRAGLKAGETILIHGAAGGVGLAAVDLARHLGARVIATSASEEKLQALKNLGAHHVVRAAPGFAKVVKALTNGKGADVIFDPVGGDVFDESTHCIAFNGRLLVIGFASGRIPALSVNMALIKGFSLMGVRAGEYGRQFPQAGADNWQAVHDLAAGGHIRPHVGAVFPLEDIRQAFEAMLARKIVGKIVIQPG